MPNARDWTTRNLEIGIRDQQSTSCVNRGSRMNRYRRLLPIVQSLPASSVRSTVPGFYVAPFNVLRVRDFSTSRPTRSPNFDTLKVVQRLEEQGFTPEQSKAVMELLKDVIDESILGLGRSMVTREEQDKVSPSHSNLLRQTSYLHGM